MAVKLLLGLIALIVIVSMALPQPQTLVKATVKDNFSSISTDFKGENTIHIDDYIEGLWGSVSNLSNTPYELHKFDCTEFTNNFIDILKEHEYLNVSYTAVFGVALWDCDYCLHCWIEIDGKVFEATNGKFANNSLYGKKKELEYCV